MSDDRTAPPADVRRRMYELMMLMKAADDRMTTGIMSGEFLAVYFPHRGQEATAAALGAALRRTDQLVTTYRGLHDHIGKGVPMTDLFAEILGKGIAPGRGKAGTMHIASPDAGVMLSTGIVGSGIPVAVGLALGSQMEGSDRVTAVCFGDGATNTGAFHEATNLAALWNLPLVLVCQNNLYGENTPIGMTMKIDQVAERARGYGIPGVRVNGNDPDEAYGALCEAVERARSGGGTTLVECVTYRFRGHSIGDAMAYMPEEERAAAEANDPIPAYRAALLSSGGCTEDDLVAIEKAAVATVEDAATTVLDAELPSTDELLAHVYANAENAPA
jgi:acetoin:2,6-dichlorophenolindophenol oxidoreductase subunit alpha